MAQFGRYLVVGCLAFGIDFGALALLTEQARLHYLFSAACAFLLGLTVNYILSRTWVFQSRRLDNTSMEFLIFAGIGIAGLFLNEIILWTAQERLNIHYLAAKIASAGIVLVWNFGARKVILFR